MAEEAAAAGHALEDAPQSPSGGDFTGMTETQSLSNSSSGPLSVVHPLYRDLPLSGNQIRLLKIVSSSEHTNDQGWRTKCILYRVSLDEDLDYDALSYTWGDATVRRPVNINGHVISVTRNLARALLRFGPEKGLRRRPLWADAICINQVDLVEKNHQVAMMGEIYRRAAHVRIWTGFGTPRSELILPRLREISQLKDTDESDPSRDMELADAYREFCRGWWHRLWVVQEAALAQDPVLYRTVHGRDATFA